MANTDSDSPQMYTDFERAADQVGSHALGLKAALRDAIIVASDLEPEDGEAEIAHLLLEKAKEAVKLLEQSTSGKVAAGAQILGSFALLRVWQDPTNEVFTVETMTKLLLLTESAGLNIRLIAARSFRDIREMAENLDFGEHKSLMTAVLKILADRGLPPEVRWHLKHVWDSWGVEDGWES